MFSLVLVTGAVNAGKTTVMKSLSCYLAGDGPEVPGLPRGILPPPPMRVGGFLTESVVREGRKTAFSIREIQGPGFWHLVAENPDGENWLPGPRRFWRNPDGFTGVRESLLGKIDRRVLFLDEAGPLEMEGQGHAPLLDELSLRFSGTLVLSIREDLADQARNRWGRGDTVILKVLPGVPGGVYL